MTKLSFHTFFLIIGFLLISCSNNTKKNTKIENIQSKNNLIYVSEDKNYKFELLKIGDDINLRNIINNKSYKLKHTQSGSGVKYMNKNNYIFWTKGEDFIWAKGDSTITTGHLLKSHGDQ